MKGYDAPAATAASPIEKSPPRATLETLELRINERGKRQAAASCIAAANSGEREKSGAGSAPPSAGTAKALVGRTQGLEHESSSGRTKGRTGNPRIITSAAVADAVS